ncbi:hypothetical protein ACK39F_08365 [Aeromonas veronii]
MRDNALYFPYISLPNEKWTIKTLLYWDRLSSIVPMEYINAPDQLSPFMRLLVQENLVEQIFPAQHLYQIPDFETCFIKMIEHRTKNNNGFANNKTMMHHEKINSRTLIHAEKMGSIPDFLIDSGLASRTDRWAWFEVDTRIANLFMAYLASCLGALDEVNAAPVTNQVRFSSIITPPSISANSNSVHHHKARDVILHSLLPTPDERVSLDQLLRFKSDYGHLLPLLRRKIEAHCASVAILPNVNDRLNLTKQFIFECMDDVNEITEAMKPTWKKITLGSIAPLFGAGFTLEATNTNDELAYAGAALSFAAAAYQAISSIRGSRVNQLKKPLAYIAHARSGIYA